MLGNSIPDVVHKMELSLIVQPVLAYKELGYGNGLSNEDYKKLQEQRKALISNRIAEFEEMISMGARVFELRYGEL